MATSLTPNIHLQVPAVGDRPWAPNIIADYNLIDSLAPVGGLAVTTVEVPSASLNVAVAAGSYIDASGTVATFAGSTSQAITTNTTKVLYLDLTASGALTVANGYPTTPHVRLATVVAGSGTITSIADNRQCFNVAGAWADGVNIALGTTTGTKIGTSASQKLALWGATPIVQPSGAAQASLVDSTGGVVGTTLAACGNTSTGDQSATINANIASLNNLLEAIRTALVNAGIMKGSA